MGEIYNAQFEYHSVLRRGAQSIGWSAAPTSQAEQSKASPKIRGWGAAPGRAMQILLTSWVLVALALFAFAQPGHAASIPTQERTSQSDSGAIVAQVDFAGADELNDFAAYLDIWAVDHASGTFTALS